MRSNAIAFKIIVATFFILMLSSGIPSLILSYFWWQDAQEIFSTKIFVISALASWALAFMMMVLHINRTIITRIKALDLATKEVINGNFDILIEIKGRDELSSLASSFSQMTMALKKNEFLNKEFSRNFTHEFKTPLAVIGGYVRLVKDGKGTEEERKNYLSIIESETIRLSSLSKGMLDLSMIDNVSITEKKDRFQLSKQVRSIMQMMQIQWEDKNLEVNLILEDFYIISNKEMTYQAIMNLISNAIKYAFEGTKLDIYLFQKGDLMKFSITNQGEPISKEDLDKVFDLFFVLHPEKADKSSGVGLTLTKRIIEKLDGTIYAECTGNSISFSFELPTRNNPSS